MLKWEPYSNDLKPLSHGKNPWQRTRSLKNHSYRKFNDRASQFHQSCSSIDPSGGPLLVFIVCLLTHWVFRAKWPCKEKVSFSLEHLEARGHYPPVLLPHSDPGWIVSYTNVGFQIVITSCNWHVISFHNHCLLIFPFLLSIHSPKTALDVWNRSHSISQIIKSKIYTFLNWVK